MHLQVAIKCKPLVSICSLGRAANFGGRPIEGVPRCRWVARRLVSHHGLLYCLSNLSIYDGSGAFVSRMIYNIYGRDPHIIIADDHLGKVVDN